MAPSVPKPDESLVLVDWESEVVKELQEDGMYGDMVTMATEEMQKHIDDLRKMQGQQGPEDWENWPPYKVAHSIKGLCLSLSFTRLAEYAKDVEKLKTTIEKDNLQEIIEHVDRLFTDSIDEANRSS
mmetsp:Transcript_15641/g.48931  ORF Transcript_15641/g.48931 Transcript_15641/m.48931 type:complete len:127 (-) Transcript_15641:335-715(-)